MKKILVGLVAIMVLGAGVYFLLRSDQNDRKYRTEKVTRGDIVSSITATGAVNATTVLVGTQVSGTIKDI